MPEHDALAFAVVEQDDGEGIACLTRDGVREVDAAPAQVVHAARAAFLGAEVGRPRAAHRFLAIACCHRHDGRKLPRGRLPRRRAAAYYAP